ncbi:MAG: heme-copper oxidase subunit III [Elusimicrobia bacterium]|nr:heme-copper oxidase subunit III [Elusimicrobiota bacterium]
MATAATADESVGWPEPEIGRLGLWLFIISEVMLFGAFFASYLSTRLGNPDCALGISVWPEAGHLPGLALASLNTMLLLTSSYTMVRAIAGAERGERARFRQNLIATIALGALFLVVKAVEYKVKISHGYYPGSELAKASGGLAIFLSYYYLMTSLHGLHVVAGLVWNGVVLSSPEDLEPEALTRRCEYAGLYWHFVDVIWVFLFPLFYLI